MTPRSASQPHGRRVRRQRRAAAILVLGAAAMLSAGCAGSGGGAGSGTQSATGFIEQVTTEFSRGQSGRLWDQLYPADQALVSRARYVQCEGNEGFGLKSVKVLDSFPEPVDVNGVSEHSEAVTVQVTSDDGKTTATVHAISSGGGWRWILSPAQRAAYKSGKCP
jgi:hypothetical protein